MMAYYYLKLYHDTLHDPKMGMLSDHLYRRVIEIFLMASERPERDGYLPTLDVMAWELHVDKDELEFDLMQIEKQTGIVVAYPGGVWFVTNFVKRQASTDPTAAERMKRYRERNESVTHNEDVTRNVTVTDDEKLRVELIVKNKNLDIDIEENKIKAADAATAAASFSPSIPDANLLLQHYTMTTGMVALPSGSYKQDMSRLDALYRVHRGALTEYLRPFWTEWINRKYNKTNTAWLDWAIANQIPERKTEPRNNGNSKSADTLARLQAMKNDKHN